MSDLASSRYCGPMKRKCVPHIQYSVTIQNFLHGFNFVQVQFKVNDVPQNYSMKLGEGGEAFFVFETSEEIPEDLQTSPLISPATSPPNVSAQDLSSSIPLQEPDFLDIGTNATKQPLEAGKQGSDPGM